MGSKSKGVFSVIVKVALVLVGVASIFLLVFSSLVYIKVVSFLILIAVLLNILGLWLVERTEDVMSGRKIKK